MDRSRTKSSLDNICHFSQLPGELRNKVYEYALTEENGLIFQIENNVGILRSGTVTTEVAPECAHMNPSPHAQPYTASANQLQYVSRQLRAETKGLGIRFNDITFVGEKAIKHAVRFLKVLPPSELRYLRTITIRGPPGHSTDPAVQSWKKQYPLTTSVDKKYIRPLAQCCQSVRHATIRLAIPAYIGLSQLIIRACQLKYALSR
jgi:hypothetical protein